MAAHPPTRMKQPSGREWIGHYRCKRCSFTWRQPAGPVECKLCGGLWIEWLNYLDLCRENR